MKNLITTLKSVFSDILYLILALSLSLNLYLFYHFIFQKTTTLTTLFSQTTPFYAITSLILTILTALLFGTSFSLLIYRWQKISNEKAVGSKDLMAGFLGALSMGCPVCGGFLLPLLGIAAGLSIFPFQGLELKIAALLLFSFSIYQSSRVIPEKTCLPSSEISLLQGLPKEKLFKFEGSNFILNLNKNTLYNSISFLLPFLILIFVLASPFLPAGYKFNFAKENQPAPGQNQKTNSQGQDSQNQNLFEQINPASGYEINATYGDLGPKLIAAGAIDFEKMKLLYEQAGTSLTEEQIKILKEGSNEKIKITPENSYFLLNFFWAVGLANKNPILDEGPMAQYGGDELGSFASTGGWTLGKKEATQLYSKFEIINLNQEQQKALEDFAYNSYRPCCSNPTAFPDCNHGMAALALGEIMAAQGASADEIFEAFKYVNAFWFPQTYFDIAKYFQAKEGKNWGQADARLISGKDFSTPQGWQRARNWLKGQGLLEEAPSGGGGCGV